MEAAVDLTGLTLKKNHLQGAKLIWFRPGLCRRDRPQKFFLDSAPGYTGPIAPDRVIRRPRKSSIVNNAAVLYDASAARLMRRFDRYGERREFGKKGGQS